MSAAAETRVKLTETGENNLYALIFIRKIQKTLIRNIFIWRSSL